MCSKKTFDELLADPPGNGISVQDDGTQIRIDIRGKAAITPKRIAVVSSLSLLGFCCFTIVLIVAFCFLPQLRIWILGLLLLVILVGAISQLVVILGIPFLCSVQLPAAVVVCEHKVILHGPYKQTRLDWSEIKAITSLHTQRPSFQRFPDLDLPIRKGTGDGVAFSTNLGVFRSLLFWHDEVCDWIADLLCAFAKEHGYQLCELGHDATKPTPPEFPKQIDRPSLRKIGIGGGLLTGIFILGFWTPVYEAMTCGNWHEAAAVITKSKEEKKRDGKTHYVIEYQYEVEGVEYSSDRYSFDAEYSYDVEQAKRRYAIGDEVTIRYAPHAPSRAVIRAAIPRGKVVIIGVMGIGFVASIIAFVNSFIAVEHDAARRYDVELKPTSRKKR